MREVWVFERLGWQPFFQSLGQCYLTAEDWIWSNYSINADLPEMTKKLPLQVPGHQVLVPSEPDVRSYHVNAMLQRIFYILTMM